MITPGCLASGLRLTFKILCKFIEFSGRKIYSGDESLKILAIETSCDETAVAVVNNGREVLSSVVLSQIEEHRLYGGVVPEIASRRHAEGIVGITEQALEEAKLAIEELDAVAVTFAPGLIGALLVGVNFAKGIALAAGKPLIPVHHIRGHVAANYIAYPELKPPFLCLIVSGGHSHIVRVDDYVEFTVLGRTRDDAAGEAFDKVARVLGLPYPGGVEIDRSARSGNHNAFRLPHPRLDAPYDFSFSGLKTAVINLVHNEQQKGDTLNVKDVAASFQHTVCKILADRFFAAADETKIGTLVAAGGVSANSELRRTLDERAREKNLAMYLPPVSLCGDNAAMIGAQAYYEALAGNYADLSLNARASSPMEGQQIKLKP